jgi:hypothetical protein
VQLRGNIDYKIVKNVSNGKLTLIITGENATA